MSDNGTVDFMPPDEIRTLFSTAMSDMYRKEVPQYGTLIELVHDVNRATLEANPDLRERLTASGEVDRLEVERHGAIRLGTPDELRNIGRMFAIMGMYPVGYYDLSVAGIPVHSTAFRPLSEAALQRNPFRVFCSLLRLELIEEPDLAAKARQLLSERQIITEGAMALIEQAEAEGGLEPEAAQAFVVEALETFRWHSEATVDAATYEALLKAHRLIADVVSFKGPHINHLTPRTLDIDAVQAQMPERGITPKAVVEGPPRRTADILLRQTSFKALEEDVLFLENTGSGIPGTHTARFGEIEQRGIALTPKGRSLYDELLAKARAAIKIGPNGERASEYMRELENQFAGFPDSFEVLREEGLAFFRYRANPAIVPVEQSGSIEDLIASGRLIADPQTYEDFLPVSAAGIFQSNLGTDAQSNYTASANRNAFEDALGKPVQDEMELYARQQLESLRSALSSLGRSDLL
jgi:uncharacterized glyoxalase superfamily metalloenzyme YdcJ